ncbi:hypothetical protein COHA_002842 [Chlorella ohadii]|uniref:Uncharacterized protein n=1 Tax=Chlorella ohadii TaxID=2649997 RepID=A0AAD5DWW2_9CHLO|nr:hypothetical protein COHA_002842 [Chlorella ohadii]
MAGAGPGDPTPTEGELDLMDLELGQLDAAEIGGVADQVTNLLAGSHPSARGADLAEWLSAAEPVVSLEEGLAEVAAAGPGVDSPPQQQPSCGLMPAGAFALPPVASPAALGSAAIAAGAVSAPLPLAGAPLSIQQQLALRKQLEEQQAGFAQLPPLGYGALEQPGFALQGWQQQQQQQAVQAGAPQLFAPGIALDSPGAASSMGGSTSVGPPLGLPIVGGDAAGGHPPAYSSAVFAALPEQPDASMFEPQPTFSSDHSAEYAVAGGSGSGDYSAAVAAAGGGGGGGGAKPSNKKFTNRQQTRISAIEAELQRLQREMAAIKLENQALKAKKHPVCSMSLSIQNQEVEQQLRTQEQLQQLAAAVGSATAAASGAGRPAGAAGLRAPPLVSAVATSPPNSQRKLLMHLTVSARPADAEMLKVSALTWPKLVDWYRAQYARFREALGAAPPGGGSEAEHLAKEAMRVGRYWDLLALICRPDLCVRMLNEDMSATPTAAPPAGSPPPTSEATWPAAALAAAALPAAQRASLAGAWRQHCEAAAQRAQHRQELLAQIREGFLQPLQVAKPEEMELGKPLARRGLELLSPSQWAKLVVVAWPFYPDPSKWAPLLVAEAKASEA